MPSREKLAEFTAWCQNHIPGDENGQAQSYRDRRFELQVGGSQQGGKLSLAMV